MSAQQGSADGLGGMHVTTAPWPERGRAHARLNAHLDALERLDPARRSATERLEEALGAELARKLVFALVGGNHRYCWVTAAA